MVYGTELRCVGIRQVSDDSIEVKFRDPDAGKVSEGDLYNRLVMVVPLRLADHWLVGVTYKVRTECEDD